MYEKEPKIKPEVVIEMVDDELGAMIAAHSDISQDRAVKDGAPLADYVDGYEDPDSFAEEVEEQEITRVNSEKTKESRANSNYNIAERGKSNGGILEHKTAKIGEDTYIVAGCTVGEASVIGKNCTILGRFIGREIAIGDRAIVEIGVDIGAQGSAKGWKRPAVEIGNDVILREGVKVRPNSAVGDRTQVGKGSIVGYQPPTRHNPGREKRGNDENSPKTIVGEDCQIGEKVRIEAGAIIGNGYNISAETNIPKDFTIGNSEDTGIGVLNNTEILRQQAKRTKPRRP